MITFKPSCFFCGKEATTLRNETPLCQEDYELIEFVKNKHLHNKTKKRK